MNSADYSFPLRACGEVLLLGEPTSEHPKGKLYKFKSGQIIPVPLEADVPKAYSDELGYLSSRERKAFDYLLQCEQTKVHPSLEEISLSYRSTPCGSGGRYIIDRLEEKGWIQVDRSRGTCGHRYYILAKPR